MRTMIVSATIDQPHERPTESCRCSSSQRSDVLDRAEDAGEDHGAGCLAGGVRSAAAAPAGCSGASAPRRRRQRTSLGRARTRGRRAPRTRSTTGGTCRWARRPRRARGRRRAGAGSRYLTRPPSPAPRPRVRRASRRRGSPPPRQGRPRDEHVVAAGGDPLEPRAPGLAQPPLDAVPVDRAARPLRHGDPQPRLAVVVAREPVEDEEARRDRAAVAVDRVEVPRAREAVAALHDRGRAAASGGEPLPALGAAPLEDRAAGAGRHARTEAVLALPPAHVGLVGPLHEGPLRQEERRPLGPRSEPSIDKAVPCPSPRVLHRLALWRHRGERPSKGRFSGPSTIFRHGVHTCGEPCGTGKALQIARFLAPSPERPLSGRSSVAMLGPRCRRGGAGPRGWSNRSS